MISIRPEQYARFEEDAWRDFIRRAVEHMRLDMSDYITGMSERQLEERVETSVELASKYDLVNEQDVICFLDAGLLLNDERFADNSQYAPIRAILQDEELAPDERAEQALALAFQQTYRG